MPGGHSRAAVPAVSGRAAVSQATSTLVLVQVRPGCLHGSCVSPLDCLCEPGWRGELCDIAVCAPGCSAEHGTCSRPGECICRLGWAGQTCNSPVCSPQCMNGGACAAPGVCDCPAGFQVFSDSIGCDLIEG